MTCERFVLKTKPARHFQVGEDGRVYAAVQYPSMSELWPDIYRTKAVRVVQVSSTSVPPVSRRFSLRSESGRKVIDVVQEEQVEGAVH